MRLIDADDLLIQIRQIDFLKVPNSTKLNACEIMKIINKQPTAYDISKVVAELEEKLTCDDFGTCNYCQYRWCSRELLEADETIDIVRKGGVNE